MENLAKQFAEMRHALRRMQLKEMGRAARRCVDRLNPAMVVPDPEANPEIPEGELERAKVIIDFSKCKVAVGVNSLRHPMVTLTLEMWESGYSATEPITDTVEAAVAAACVKLLNNRDLRTAIGRVIDLRLASVRETPHAIELPTLLS